MSGRGGLQGVLGPGVCERIGSSFEFLLLLRFEVCVVAHVHVLFDVEARGAGGGAGVRKTIAGFCTGADEV